MTNDIVTRPDGLEQMAEAFDRALNPQAMPPKYVTEATLSLISQNIAELLCDADHVQAGRDPQPFRDVSPERRARFQHLAERAIQTLSATCYDAAIEHAVNETLIWVDRRPASWIHPPSTEDIVREALSFFLAHWARPVER